MNTRNTSLHLHEKPEHTPYFHSSSQTTIYTFRPTPITGAHPELILTATRSRKSAGEIHGPVHGHQVTRQKSIPQLISRHFSAHDTYH